ncbi:putative tubulin-tyrosine ligase [Diplodia seriata]|uniref:Putative tubulin-tyrosine ligase n=1 Tax=Diplodia seriata TaxID=420778 RepID=A0A0G2EM28_9PEZI|nr:putative tubulin-tyrosine ligase [Diplodia seriata]
MTASTTGSDDEEYVKGAIEIVKDTLLAPVRHAFSKPARRAYIQTLLLILGTFVLLGVAIAAYSVFYLAYVPTRGFSVPVHLQYPSSSSSPSFSQQDRSFAELRDEFDVVENVNKAVEMPWYLLGWRRESERLVVGMMEGVRFERGWGNVAEALRVELRAVERLQVYAVRVVFEAKLRGLRYIMYNYRLPSALVFTTLFWFVELIFMVLAWLALSQIFSPAAPRTAGNNKPTKASEQEEPATKPDEDETEIDLNKIKSDPDETEETTDVPDLSDTPRTFPTYRGQRPLRYESPRVKSEEEDEEGETATTAESAVDIAGVAPEQEADDEDDEDADFVLDTAGSGEK